MAVVSSRAPSVVASAHGPALTGDRIGRAVQLYEALPGTTPPRGPAHDELSALLAAHHP